MKRDLSPEEMAKLGGVVSDIASEHSRLSALSTMELFLEGDASIAAAALKLTNIVAVLHQFLLDAFGQNLQTASTSAALRVATLLTVMSQSTRVVLPFIEAACVHHIQSALQKFTSHALKDLVHFLAAALDSLDGERVRSALSSLLAPVVQARLVSSRDEVDIVELSFLIERFVGWPSNSPASMNFALAVVEPLLGSLETFQQSPTIVVASSRALSVALLTVDPSTLATERLVSCVSILRTTALQNPHPDIMQALAVIFCANAKHKLGRDREIVNACTPICNVNEFSVLCQLTNEVVTSLSNVRRSATQTEALSRLDALVRQTSNDHHPLLRQCLIGAFDAIRTLVSPLTSIDEQASSIAARLCAFAVQGNALASARFVTLGGVTALFELLGDYSAEVLTSSLMLLSALTNSPMATRAVIDGGHLTRLNEIFTSEVLSEKAASSDVVAEAILLYLQSVSNCAGLAAAPPSQFSAFWSGLNQLARSTHDASDQNVRTEILCLDAMSALLRSAWPSSDGERERYCVAWLDESIAALHSTSTVNLFLAYMRLGTSTLAYVSASEKATAAQKLNMNVVHQWLSSAQLVLASYEFLASLTSGSKAAVTVMLDLPDGQRVCRSLVQSLSDIATSITSDPSGALATPPDFTSPMVHFLSHVVPQIGVPESTAFIASTTVLVSSKRATLSLRKQCIDALQNTPQLDATVASDLAHHLFAVLLACEEDLGEAASMVANRAFKLMLRHPEATIAALLTIAAEAFVVFDGKPLGTDTPYRSPSRRSREWKWRPLDVPEDADDAHDLLVAVLPLINGLLHHDQKCCDAILAQDHAEGWLLLLTCLEHDQTEIGLKIVVILALGNLLGHCRNTAAALPAVQHAMRLSAALSRFRSVVTVNFPMNVPAEFSCCPPLTVDPRVRASAAHLASLGLPSITAVNDAIETMYFFCERLVIFARAAKSPHFTLPFAANTHIDVYRWATRDAESFPTARSCILCLLQSEGEVLDAASIDPACRADFEAALTVIERVDQNGDTLRQVHDRRRFLRTIAATTTSSTR